MQESTKIDDVQQKKRLRLSTNFSGMGGIFRYCTTNSGATRNIYTPEVHELNDLNSIYADFPESTYFAGYRMKKPPRTTTLPVSCAASTDPQHYYIIVTVLSMVSPMVQRSTVSFLCPFKK